MYKYKVVITKHLQPRKYHYAYNDQTGKWQRITSYDFTLATINKDCSIQQVSDNETVYIVRNEGITLSQSELSQSVIIATSEVGEATDNTDLRADTL